jgi:hypothetical protein
MRFIRWAPAALALAVLFAPKAKAEITEDSGKFEIFTGWYFPDSATTNNNENWDDWTAGLRGGYNFTQHFGMDFGVQGYRTSQDVGADNLDIEYWLVDVSFAWYANPEDKAVFTLFGGPGYASRDWNWDVANAKDFDQDGISAHVGIAGEIQCTDHFYIRPEALVRWIPGQNDVNNLGTDLEDATDWQVGIGWGWYIGN